MDDGQKIDINLESPLDTKSSDMLVSVNDVRFAHNRQKYQGHVLPTSLRYERNGWAAGWYVYDFAISGGYIFSRNSSNDIYLAATRSKLNTTPIYVYSFKTAINNNSDDPDAVSSAIQFQAWHINAASINARECTEAIISDDLQPDLFVNYAVEGTDYKRKFKFNFDVCSNQAPTFTRLDSEYGDADLAMEYVERAPDGTVTATLYNNSIKWKWDTDLYVPKDLIDINGYKFAKFSNVTDGIITWKLGDDNLYYSNANNTFTYKSIVKNPNESLTISYSIPLTYTVPLHKYYSGLKNISWAIQGTRTLFNGESSDIPTNRYNISIDHLTSSDAAIYNGNLSSVGIDGPDVSVTSEAKFNIASVQSAQNKQVIFNTETVSDVKTLNGNQTTYIPIATVTTSGFKMPGSSDSRNVTIQIYYKYTQEAISVGLLDGRVCYAYVIDYAYANMSNSITVHEPIQTNDTTDEWADYTVDGKHIGVTNYADINATVSALEDKARVASRDIVGYVFDFMANIKGINDVTFSDNNAIELQVKGITSNLIFSRATQLGEWQENIISDEGLITLPYDNDPRPFKDVQDPSEKLRKLVPLRFFNHDQQASHNIAVSNEGYVAWLGVTGTRGNYTLTVTTPNEVITGFTWVFGSPMNLLSNYNNDIQYLPDVLGPLANEAWTLQIVDVFSIHDDIYLLYKVNDHMSETPNDKMYGITSLSALSSRTISTDDTDTCKGSLCFYNGIQKYVFGALSFNTFERTSNSIQGSSVKCVAPMDGVPRLGSNTVDDFYATFLLDDTIYGFLLRDNSAIGYHAGVIKPIVTFSNNLVEHIISAGNTETGPAYIYDIDYQHPVHFSGSTPTYSAVYFYTAQNSVLYAYHYNFNSDITEVDTFDYKLVQDYWVSVYDRSLNKTLSIQDDAFIDKFCMDIIDSDTGEVLVNHDTDNITFEGTPVLRFIFDEDHIAKGKLFFDSTLNPQEAYNADVAERNVYNNVDGASAKLHIEGNMSQAFFPVMKYKNAHETIYNYANNSGVQGIAVFYYDGQYFMSVLSPLNKYILPPKLTGETLYVYASKAFTHHIKFSAPSIINNVKLIDDNSTNISNISMTTRDLTTVFASSDIESNGKYYTNKHLLTPASISYYNNQIHITYTPISGSSTTVANNTYDLGTSDISVKQEADLVNIYLPEHLDDKYHFAIGNHDNVIDIKETKEIMNTIADINKHRVTVTVYSVDFTGAVPNVTLKFTEEHENSSQNINRTISYTDILNIQDNAVTTFSDENQLVIQSSISGNAIISLPDMPNGKFVYDIADNKVDVYSIVNGTSNQANRFTYDYASNTVSNMFIQNKELSKANIKLTATDNSNVAYNVYSIDINQAINTTVYFKHFGIYKIVSKQIGNYTPHVTSVSYNKATNIFTLDVVDMSIVDGMSSIALSGTYTFNFNDFEDPTLCTAKTLVYTATDVRNPDPNTQTKEFARVVADSEYQLIKQHWDSTVATECFWWIDSTHTLELTKDRFILKVKDSEAGYDDWMGDRWRVVYSIKRTDYITSECDNFIVSSASGKTARGYLYILQPETTNSIRITIYDPLNLVDNKMMIVGSWSITFKHITLSTKTTHSPLNYNNMIDSNGFIVCTYSDIIASSLLSDCKLTAVNINGVHWLGIQYDKNFNQWSFAFGSRMDIVQGYGVVGINGYATGGMLPAKYFSNNGFNSEVFDISELETEKGNTLKTLDDFNIFNERVVGDENQQWYISEELNDIVMAVNLTNSNIVKLPITNKYAQIYSSPSYAKYTVHALGIQIKQLMDLFTDEQNPIWLDIIKYAMFPIVWYLSPYTNVINYLQQTLGQYAYTHYNSTSISRKSSKLHDEVDTDNAGLSKDELGSHIDTLITDDLSFDVQHIPQEQSFKDNSWDNILGIFASMVVSATDMAMRDITVNQLQNQSAVNDIGKKFSQAFLQNIGSMSVTGFTMQSTKPMLKSEVTAVKTLDMFYSTSAEQNCFAGPGFVNMQFVAQCTAQSVTSVQLEAQQTQMFMLLRELTTWQSKAIIFLIDTLKDFMFKMSDNMAGGPSAGLVVGLGWIGALVVSGLGYAMVAAKAMVKLGIEAVDSMLDSFFPSGVKTTVTAQLSRHNYDIEGKHAYGNKSEQFFWPCADCQSKLYTDESVEAVIQEKPWPLEMPTTTSGNNQFKPIYQDQPDCITISPSIMLGSDWNGEVPYNIAMCKGKQTRRALPDSTAYVIGTESFMPTSPFKNENIGEGEPVFTPPAVQDYIIDKNWNIFVTAMAGDALWVSCKDTKLFDGNYSNIVVTDEFCGIAAPHVAIEVKRDICEEYLRPWAVSPDAIALNITGLNCAYDEVAYHAFDGYGYRITDWLGASGMNKERYTWQYCFQINDRFKRSNKLPPNQFMGNFQALPSLSLDIKDKVFNEVTVVTEEKGLRTGVAGENKDTQRYALPIFTEQISSLPAVVRALSPYKLAVIDGITSLTTDVRVSQSVYKIPDSVDFNINDKLYRITNEYICSVKHEKGLEVVEYLVPALGLKYLGATPFMAYFYNQATRQYYIYQGGNTLQVMDMLERFRDIKNSTYDFINQEVVMPCLATFDRLDNSVKDDTDETDNIVIPVFRHNKVGGEVTPPIPTIFNTRSWYRTISTPAGLVFQGPNRCIINRFVWSQYMLSDIKANKGKWQKVPREEYHPFRTYAEKYDNVLNRLDSKIKGWTHNPFLLVTSPLGIKEEVDCKFEWEITFAWTVEMEQLYERDEYVTVNVMAETMTPGGKVFNRPTHIYLHRDLFTRSNNFGYYSFRYQSNNGMGNRERLHIWSDGYIAVSSLQLEYKSMSPKRSEILVTQEDIKGMKEM